MLGWTDAVVVDAFLESLKEIGGTECKGLFRCHDNDGVMVCRDPVYWQCALGGRCRQPYISRTHSTRNAHAAGKPYSTE